VLEDAERERVSPLRIEAREEEAEEEAIHTAAKASGRGAGTGQASGVTAGWWSTRSWVIADSKSSSESNA
jgi:hypothetical protein